jgi:PAS domain S-box-containing protein
VIAVSARATDARLLAAVLENSSDAVVFVDGGGMVSRWNDAAEKMFGFSQDGASTSSFEKLFPPEWHEEMADVLVRASLGQSAHATAVAVRSDGSRLIVETTCSAVTGFNSASSDYVVLLKDVTESILVRASAAAVAFEADASAAIESLALVLGYVMPVENLTLTAMEGRGTARRVASAGRCAAKLQTGELLPTAGTALAMGTENRQPIVCHDTSTGDLPYDTVLAKFGVGSYVVLPLFHGGRIAATLNIGFAAPGVPTPSVVGLLSSLTASVMPIVLNLVTLEEQAGAIRQLEQLDELKNEFLALITHDMRTPLAVIAGFAEQLQDRWSELPDPEKLDSVDAILRNGRNLYRLVEEGLEIARIESGGFAYELRPVALEDEVERTVADLAAADADRIRISAERGLPLVRCDTDRHWHVLTNLLSNALKFSAPETAVHVELSRRGSVVQVAVRDHGPGIEPSDLPKLFQKFSRVGTQSLAPGKGLGLYVSKAMIEAQGGHMSVQSEPGRGSTFVYTLPATEAGAG